MKKLRITLLTLVLLALLALVYLMMQKMAERPRRADPEFQKLMHIWDFYKGQDLKVVVDGVEQPLEFVRQRGQKYLIDHYEKGMTARAWIEEHAYRSKKGEITYFKYGDGTTRPMRDVFLEQLEEIESAS